MDLHKLPKTTNKRIRRLGRGQGSGLGQTAGRTFLLALPSKEAGARARRPLAGTRATRLAAAPRRHPAGLYTADHRTLRDAGLRRRSRASVCRD